MAIDVIWHVVCGKGIERRSMNESGLIVDANVCTPKPDGKICRIREQILRDPASGLTFQFEVDEQGRTRFRIFGDALPAGNWEIGFENGELSFTGTSLRLCKPTWATSVDDL